MSGQAAAASKRPVQPQPTYGLSSNPSYGAAGVQHSPQSPQSQYGGTTTQYPQRYPSPQGRSLPMSMGSQPYSPQVSIKMNAKQEKYLNEEPWFFFVIQLCFRLWGLLIRSAPSVQFSKKKNCLPIEKVFLP